MKHELEVEILKELMRQLDEGKNVDAGVQYRMPTTSYVCPETARREQEEFFRNCPQLIGLSDDLPEEGSFFTMNDFGTPLLATRDKKGVFHAFLNACRHRSVKVTSQDRGKRSVFMCPFHNWSYSNTGDLISIPDEDHFGPVDKSCRGLLELPAIERGGLLWVHPKIDGKLEVDELLGGLQSELASVGMEKHKFVGDKTIDKRLNWKFANDTFGETYHFNSLHRDSLANFFQGNVQCYDTYGQHHRMILCKKAIHEMREWPEDQWDITVAGLPVYWIFPNNIVMPSEWGLYVVRAYPDETNPGKHTSVISFYVRGDKASIAGTNNGLDERQALLETAPLEALSEIAQGFAAIIRDEDYVASASQQRSANSGTLDHVIFGRNEPALHHYHNTYRAALGLDLLPLLDPASMA